MRYKKRKPQSDLQLAFGMVSRCLFVLISYITIAINGREVLITNEQTHTCIKTSADDINIYLEGTVFESYLDFGELSDKRDNNTLEMFMDDFITADNEWIFHRIFEIVQCKPDLTIPYRMKPECKQSMMTMSDVQWNQFCDTCNMLGFYGFDSKTTMWKVFEYSRIDIPPKLHMILRHDAVDSIHGLPTQYTPLSHQCYVKLFVKEIWMNEHKFTAEQMTLQNDSEIFMFRIKSLEGQITINYENAVGKPIDMYNDPRLSETVHTFQMLGIKDTLYDTDYSIYGWTADVHDGVFRYLFQEQAHIQHIMGILYADFYDNIIERYGYDSLQSSMNVGMVHPYGLVAEFKLLR